MKNILFIAIAIVALAMVGAVSAVGPTLTVISGTIYQADNTTVVPNAAVTVTCTHNSIDYVRTTTSSGVGSYGVVFPVSQCTVSDSVLVEAVSNGADGSNTGTVDHTGRCLVNTGIINVSIPEFGVVAGAVALVGALGIFVYRRKD
jgi:hypothetical protein